MLELRKILMLFISFAIFPSSFSTIFPDAVWVFALVQWVSVAKIFNRFNLAVFERRVSRSACQNFKVDCEKFILNQKKVVSVVLWKFLCFGHLKEIEFLCAVHLKVSEGALIMGICMFFKSLVLHSLFIFSGLRRFCGLPAGENSRPFMASVVFLKVECGTKFRFCDPQILYFGLLSQRQGTASYLNFKGFVVFSHCAFA